MAKPIGSPGKGNKLFRQEEDTSTDPSATTTASDGDDLLMGTSGDDVLFGGLGDDTLVGGTGIDFLDGGEGNDTYVFDRHSDWDTYMDSGTGGLDYDRLIANESSSVVYFKTFGDANGIEEISANGYADVKIMGSSGDDLLDFTNTVLDNVAIHSSGGNDTVFGSQGNDEINGGGGDDTLVGNGGNDMLCGSFGADTLTGGDGSDCYVYKYIGEAGDTITDFETGPNGDTLILTDLMAREPDATYSIEQSGSDAVVVVHTADGSSVDLVTLNGVDTSTWSDTDNLIV